MATGDDAQSAVPTRANVRGMLRELVEGSVTRREVSDWAEPWLGKDLRNNPTIDDEVVLDGLESLSGADLEDSPHSYLHGEADFRAWLEEFEQLCRQAG